ncbi:PAS domain S-box protein [Pigmentiphaga aceris]|uniref:sensor histidine kinase n=1 Tax=Pigmentiphaga aceris TaxID=1940612 RepID=UPI00165291B7|nr:transporter substrate-binding domain-containing protein [Pigmentiphaga aceris]
MVVILAWILPLPFAPAYAQVPIWRVGVVTQAPYATLDAAGGLAGYDIDLLSRLARRAGVHLEWHVFPDTMAQETAREAGQIDMAVGALQTPMGLRHWRYTDPYLRVPMVLVGGRELDPVSLARIPADTRLLVGPVNELPAQVQQNLPALRVEVAADPQAALRQLAEGTADYALVDQVQFDRLARQRLFAGLVQIETAGYPLLRRIAVVSEQPLLLRQLDGLLAALPDADAVQLRQRWLAPPPASELSPALWRSLALLAGLLTTALAAALIWQLRQRPVMERRVTDLRRELALREQEKEALRLTQFSVDQSVTGILWVNWDSRIRYVNAAAANMLGIAPSLLLERPLEDFDPTLHMDRWLSLWKLVRDEQPPAGSETVWQRGDGSWLPVAVNLSFLRFGSAEYLVVFVLDLSEKRRADAALAEREAQLRGIAANVPGMVFRMEYGESHDGAVLTFVSDGSQALVGHAPAALTDRERGLRSLIHPADVGDYVARRDAAMQARIDWHWQGRMCTATGDERWVDLKAAMRRMDDGRFVWDGVVWDIHDNKRAELALAHSQAQLRDLSAHLETVREEEKARIAREVHDELGQVLTVLKLEFSMLGLITPDPNAAQRERLESIQRLMAQLFQLVRDVATALRPPILDAGIVSAIEWQARRFEARSGIPCLVLATDTPLVLSDAQAIGLFRVLQEALTNVMRHAQAHSLEIRLTVEDGMLALTVADDGVGFQPSANQRSFGVVGMRERVLMLGGTLTLDGEPGNGTTLQARIPLR